VSQHGGHECGSDLDPWRVAPGHRHGDEWVDPECLVGPDDRKAVDVSNTDALDDDIQRTDRIWPNPHTPPAFQE